MSTSSKERSLLEAIASSLTEMFSPNIISERVAGMLKNYDFVTKDTLAYFDKRLTQAPRDADFALDYVKQHATTPDLQRQAMAALTFKCDVLWTQLDALYFAYVDPDDPAGRLDARHRARARARRDAGAAGTGTLAAADVPRLPRGVRLRFDAVRGQHVLLAPERTFDLDANAVAVLDWSTVSRSVARSPACWPRTIRRRPRVIEADVLAMLNDLATKRVLER